MPIDRYDKRRGIEITKRDMFKQVKERRGLDSIEILATARFNAITEKQLENLEMFVYRWSRGDRWDKLAKKFYGDVDYWWVIPIFNNTPTEHHIKIGQELIIPVNKEAVISILGTV